MDDKPSTRSVYNPSIEDIETDIDKFGSNPQHFILKAGEIQEFPSYAADILEEKLATRMLWQSLPANHNRDKRMKELLSIIRV